MFEFQNLEVYKKAKVMHVLCRDLAKSVVLDSYVKDQLSRASFSIVLNIAEGSAKFSIPDRRNYFTSARASIFECVAILDVLQEIEIIQNEIYVNLISVSDELSRILYAMIKKLS